MGDNGERAGIRTGLQSEIWRPGYQIPGLVAPACVNSPLQSLNVTSPKVESPSAASSTPNVTTTTPTESDERDSKDELVLQEGQDPAAKKSRINRDPLSHRVIEKRRRDRMNNCLTNLSKLIPSSYLRKILTNSKNKGRGRIEKTEIIEMAIRYMKHLELERKQAGRALPFNSPEEEYVSGENGGSIGDIQAMAVSSTQRNKKSLMERYHQGFYDCIAEMLRFLAGVEGLTISNGLKSRLMVHLQAYCSQLSSVLFHDQMDNVEICSTVYQGPVLPQPPCDSSSIPVTIKAELGTREQPLNMSLKSSASYDVSSTGSQLRNILECRGSQNVQPGKPEGTGIRPNIVHIASHHSIRETHSVPTNLPSLPPPSQRDHVAVRYGGSSGSSSSSTTYPSSPGSGYSLPMHSPPRDLSPGLTSPALSPIFALHPSGAFYIPMSVPTITLNFGSSPSSPDCAAACHPISIPVNFSYSTK